MSSNDQNDRSCAVTPNNRHWFPGQTMGATGPVLYNIDDNSINATFLNQRDGVDTATWPIQSANDESTVPRNFTGGIQAPVTRTDHDLYAAYGSDYDQLQPRYPAHAYEALDERQIHLPTHSSTPGLGVQSLQPAPVPTEDEGKKSSLSSEFEAPTACDAPMQRHGLGIAHTRTALGIQYQRTPPGSGCTASIGALRQFPQIHSRVKAGSTLTGEIGETESVHDSDTMDESQEEGGPWQMKAEGDLSSSGEYSLAVGSRIERGRGKRGKLAKFHVEAVPVPQRQSPKPGRWQYEDYYEPGTGARQWKHEHFNDSEEVGPGNERRLTKAEKSAWTRRLFNALVDARDAEDGPHRITLDGKFTADGHGSVPWSQFHQRTINPIYIDIVSEAVVVRNRRESIARFSIDFENLQDEACKQHERGYWSVASFLRNADAFAFSRPPRLGAGPRGSRFLPSDNTAVSVRQDGTTQDPDKDLSIEQRLQALENVFRKFKSSWFDVKDLGSGMCEMVRFPNMRYREKRYHQHGNRIKCVQQKNPECALEARARAKKPHRKSQNTENTESDAGQSKRRRSRPSQDDAQDKRKRPAKRGRCNRKR